MSDVVVSVLAAVPLAVVWLMAVVEVVSRKDLTTGKRAVWLAALVFLNVVALALYVVVRPSRRLAQRSATAGGAARAVALVETAEDYQAGRIDGADYERRTSSLIDLAT